MRRVVLVFLLSAAAVVSRRPDVIFHAQFWAEDGKLWYADAYNLGVVQPFLHPAAGYFDTFPRLAALAGLLLPIVFAPLLFNCIAIVFQVLPAQFLLSSRCSEWGSVSARALLAFLYVGLPNSQEMHANITNTQWHLAVLVLMILFARPGRTALWNAFDLVILILSALSGPFIIFVAPIAAILYASDSRSRRRLLLFVISGIGALIQGLAVVITGGQERVVQAMRGATPELLVQILAKQVFLAVLVGRRTLAGFSFESGSGWIVAVLAVCAGIAIEGYVLLKAPPVLKAFVLFSLGILGVSLAFPMTKSPQWPALLASGGVRYWFFPMLAFVACVVWMLHGRNPVIVRATAWALLLVMVYGIVQDWGHPRPVDFRFSDYVRKFSELPAGSTLFIPINPAGWTMQLMKR
jgi:uncharacterized membrane protein YhdT